MDRLDGPRARGAFLLRVTMEPPWAMDVTEDAPLTMVAALSGQIWLRRPASAPVRLNPGDVLLVQRTVPYILSGDQVTEPTVAIGPGQTCAGPDGRDLQDELRSGVRHWGNDPSGRDSLLVASYARSSDIGHVLTRALPHVLIVRAADSPLLHALVDEVGRDALGQASVLDRLLDVVLISVVRSWSDQAGAGGPVLLATGHDPVVAAAIRLMHDRPEQPWTVTSLAAAVGSSRASLGRRFHDAVGLPPAAYLTQWRLALAADLLGDDQLTLAAVARRVGYASAFSLSAAFTRHHGLSPRDFRRSAAERSPATPDRPESRGR